MHGWNQTNRITSMGLHSLTQTHIKKEKTMMTDRERRNAEISYHAAASGMVLLENDGTLPVHKSGLIALYGIGAVRTVRGGTGSGDPFNGGLSGGGNPLIDQSPRYHIHILRAFLDAGYHVVNEAGLESAAQKYDIEKQKFGAQGMGTFHFPEPLLSEKAVYEDALQCDTAIFVISRNSGEGEDRKMLQKTASGMEIGDYRLSTQEKTNLLLVRRMFSKMIVVLNTGGILDITEIQEACPNSILLMGLAGQEGGNAVRDILNGTITPSGKLTDTWAARYEDYPASATFADHDGNVKLEKYEEDLFIGYRYFDSFRKKPVYPFGYGLSYTQFSFELESTGYGNRRMAIRVRVRNTGKRAGREIIQVYVSTYNTGKSMPYQELKAWKKTGFLEPGQEELLEFFIPLQELKSFDDVNNCWEIPAGLYVFRVGTSSVDHIPAAKLELKYTQCVQRAYEILPLPGELNTLSIAYDTDLENLYPELPVYYENGRTTAEALNDFVKKERVITYTTDPDYHAILPYEQVEFRQQKQIDWKAFLQDQISVEDIVAALQDEELIALNCGTGWGVMDENSPVVGGNSESVPGAAGETTHMLEKPYGIPYIVLADGPGGIRVRQEYVATNIKTGEKETREHYCTAWPSGTLLAQSFDEDILREVGKAIAMEMEEIGIHILLAPGMNLHRDPLCGRNFEYFSEDPVVSGKLAAALVQGIQGTGKGVGACVKHYAANNQETNRSRVDEWISPRALRELYLRGFEIAVKEASPYAIMTSYNRINGVPTADSHDLCMKVARAEWGFQGLIMTDWNGGSSTASKSMHAGNDLIMPGGISKVREILLSLKRMEPEFDERGQVLFTKFYDIFPFMEAHWNSFIPDPDGKEQVAVSLGAGHRACEINGEIHVDGEPVFTEATDKYVFLQAEHEVCPMTKPLTVKTAEIAQEGRGLVYKGNYRSKQTICRGDLQQCAAHILELLKRIELDKNSNQHSYKI